MNLADHPTVQRFHERQSTVPPNRRSLWMQHGCVNCALMRGR